MIAMSVSKIGRPSTSAGITTTTRVALLTVPRMDSAARAKPRTCEPLSPMNVFAGWKLNGRNPRHAPARIIMHVVG